MKTLQELLQSRAEKHARMKQLLETAETEKRDLTAEEDAEFRTLEGEYDALSRDIERYQRVQAQDDAQAQIINPARRANIIVPGRSQDESEFKSFGEFLYSVRFRRNDRRLQNQEYRESEERDMSMGEGAGGGFAVPKQFIPELLQVSPQEAIFRPRARVIPAGDPPDAEVTLPTLDQSTDRNMYGGVTVSWINEGGAKPQTDARLKEVTLKPHEAAGYVVVTDKLLRNWAAAGSLVNTLLRQATIAAEETAFLTGTGNGKPLGITLANCAIKINRTTANSIVTADIDSMYGRALRRGTGLVWIASPTIIPQLLGLIDAANHRLFIPSLTGVAGAPPTTLYGLPILFNERQPALGTLGDLMLVDLGYYLIKDGSGPFIAASEHVFFTNNKTVIKVFWNVDGQPWLSSAIAVEGATTNTLSPIVLLDTP